MPANIWACDGPQCPQEMPGDLAEEMWIQVLRPGNRSIVSDTGRLVINPRLVFHSDSCHALWVRKHLIESPSQR